MNAPYSPTPEDPERRAFLGDAVKLGVASLLLGAPVRAGTQGETVIPPKTRSTASTMANEVTGLPVRVFIDPDGSGLLPTVREGGRFTAGKAAIDLAEGRSGMAVRASAPTGALARVVLRWETSFPSDAVFLGDHWERSYGDLQWRFLQPERIMPWYFAAHHPESGRTFLAGVLTQPSALCFWTTDAGGVSLWLDVRNGGGPCRPGDRVIEAATVVSLSTTGDETPFASVSRFCRILCPSPLLPASPVCGNNNWYYAYGRDFDAGVMRRDAEFLADISSGHPNRPFGVIDAGWTPGTVCPGGPWLAGDPKRFPDMPGLAAEMKRIGVRPGIWMRPTALMKVEQPWRLRAGPSTSSEKPLDISIPENLSLIHDDVARIHSWGYELIKHDFSTYDAFGKWGFEMGAEITEAGWNFSDQSLTNAEIILRLYRTLRAAAGGSVIIGCNTIGHLGAGLFEVQRTGDDTSGLVWERTRRMGVNTLAYRMPQNGAFFTCDPDCAAHTERTPWKFDSQYLDLVSRSGSALFVSVDPRTITSDQKGAFSRAVHTALSGGAPGGSEPLDWLHTTAPRHWRLGAETKSYAWEEPSGASPLRV